MNYKLQVHSPSLVKSLCKALECAKRSYAIDLEADYFFPQAKLTCY